ncbi:hypothetical protein NVV95_01715 [Herbiconiux sp. CPCC 205716]|uniref:Uncharacterized protein n=1 Tax=Herbiconiux gentiana TaxID=2970912 RepID=A0ABT2GAP0_9MICO|nr:hypothetical protein [Herbiconiux gentiana]MCS5713263.1 hypothetical protein [Herbiconiux gentiana]
MDDDTLLAVILRGRPATVEEVATLANLPADEARARTGRLRERGLIGGRDDELLYVNPASWAAETVAERSAELRQRAATALSDMESLVAELPGLLRHWAVGEASGDPVPVAIRHGRHASEDLWYDTAAHDSGSLDALLPEVDRFLEPEPERAARFGRAMAGKDRVRVILPTWAGDDPLAQKRIAAYGNEEVGVDFRLLDSPPSWFWVDGDQLALPFEWGEGRPTSVLGVRNPALAALAAQYFELLWQRATPAEPAEHSWAPLLVLMRQGVTLEAASRRLGVNPRTGRRRISAAMDHYGVATLFALGVAFGADSPR